jgi:selenophosphate synthase
VASEGVPEELLALAYDAQTAGGLLVTLPAEKALSLEAEFERAGLFLARVGSVEEGTGIVLEA